MEVVESNGYQLDELQFDRGYLPSPSVIEKHAAGTKVVTKPPTIPRNEYFAKDEFDVDFDKETITCPAGVVIPLRLGKSNAFPLPACRQCGLHDRCTKAARRLVLIHPEERWHREMADELATKEGRAQRRERVQVEHALARISAVQGNRARFRGREKNQFDLTRTAVVSNCYILDALWRDAA
jgi:hypothetical protein